MGCGLATGMECGSQLRWQVFIWGLLVGRYGLRAGRVVGDCWVRVSEQLPLPVDAFGGALAAGISY